VPLPRGRERERERSHLSDAYYINEWWRPLSGPNARPTDAIMAAYNLREVGTARALRRRPLPLPRSPARPLGVRRKAYLKARGNYARWNYFELRARATGNWYKRNF